MWKRAQVLILSINRIAPIVNYPTKIFLQAEKISLIDNEHGLKSLSVSLRKNRGFEGVLWNSWLGSTGAEGEEEEEKSGEKKRRCQSLLLRRSCLARARTRPLVPLEEEGCIGGRSEEGEKKKRKRSKRKVTAVRSEPSSGTLRKRANSVHARSDACRTTWLSSWDTFNPCLNIDSSSRAA